MQTKIFFPLCVSALLMVATNSCKKEDNVESPLSKTDILTTGQWKVSAFIMDTDGDGKTDTDLYTLYQPCEKDNYRVFQKDGRMEVNEGPTKCFGGSPQSETFPWSFANNETEIIVDGDRSTIVELTPSRFRMQALGSGLRDITFIR
jgi:hypothetical protein